jgi:hypothetical protein
MRRMETPIKRVLDPSFRYVPSHSTDVRKTFERVRRERKLAERRQTDTVVRINGKKASSAP